MRRDFKVKELFIASALLIAPLWLGGVYSGVEGDIHLTHGVASSPLKKSYSAAIFL